MHFDALTLACMVHELNTTLVEGRVQQVVLPDAHSIGLEVYAGRIRHNLLLSAQTGAAWIYCPSAKARRGVEKETPLLLLLRKYVRNAQLVAVEQPDPAERVAQLHFSHAQQGETTLVVELIGRHPNLLLLNAGGRILECVRRVSDAGPDGRILMPGRDYIPPAPQTKLSPLDDGSDDYYDRLAQLLSSPGRLWKTLVEGVAGVSPSQARELAWRATGEDNAPTSAASLPALIQSLQALWTPVQSGAWSPGVVIEHRATVGAGDGDDAGQDEHEHEANHTPVAVAGYAPYTVHFRGEFVPQPTLSAAIEQFLGEGAAASGHAPTGSAPVSRGVDAYAGQRKQVAAQLARARRRVDRQLAALAADEPAPGEAERLRTQAEWLLALQSQIAPRQTLLEVEVGADSGLAGVDPDGVLRIPLSTEKSAVEQAQQLFKRAGKLERAGKFIPQRRTQLQADLEFLDQLQADLVLAENQPEIATVQVELRATRLLPPSPRPAPRVAATAGPLRFLSPQGFEIVVGRNARQNEEVTFKIAQSEDLWLHARGVPGAHVVVRSGGQPVEDETLEAAAQLAAYYSQAQGERAATVIVTPRKQVTRAPGGRKGQVMVRQEQTITVPAELPRQVDKVE